MGFIAMSNKITSQLNLEFTPTMALLALGYQSMYGLDNVSHSEDEKTPEGLKRSIALVCSAFVIEFGIYPLKDKDHDFFKDDMDILKSHMERAKQSIIKIIPDFFD
tara:strand:+ start:49264 stop:49581 length:318 start_codon:yes stop_codon:yes gene_type:complete